jgi:hypothetical protein
MKFTAMFGEIVLVTYFFDRTTGPNLSAAAAELHLSQCYIFYSRRLDCPGAGLETKGTLPLNSKTYRPI